MIPGLDLLDDVPAWALEGAVGLVKALVKLVRAQSDDEREDAFMTAAEATKAALDRRKFGG